VAKPTVEAVALAVISRGTAAGTANLVSLSKHGNFLKRMNALFPDRRKVLHLFSGRVDFAAFPGATLDLNPELRPDYCCDAETCDGVPLHTFDFVLADPPYSESDAERYGCCMVNRNKVVATLGVRLPIGAYVVWLDQVLPMYRKDRFKIECVIGIVGSTNHRFRVLTLFRRVAERETT
jgi:hypothetical protein